ncbi:MULTISPECIES: hypothetical protein [unclassified Cryobacterium]|uniref:hypothetical protein n=1 Tax=unclassified Cryobacterium TaxID=2649013 RepID=UPI0014462A3E|nr:MULTISPECIES: hypothetical protein [unclassified Cryobacterium]
MFLNSLLKRSTDERGAAMVAVLGMTAVTAIIGITVTGSTINALATTSSARASVQSLAAAESGLDVAIAGMQATNGCSLAGGTWAAAATPSYSALVAHTRDGGGSWTDGCPTDDATHIRITSTGFAQDPGVAGSTSGDSVSVEAIYKWEPIIAYVPIAGAAVYAHDIKGVFKKFQLDTVDASVATSVMIKHGDLTCTNGARIGGDLIMGDGNAHLDMCDVRGSMHVNGNVSINKSTIGGSIRATGSLNITNSSYNAALATSGGSVPAPNIPDWTDIGWDPAFWTAQGFNIVNWTGSCSIAKNNSPWESISGYTTPTVINFLDKCPTTAVTTANSMNSVQLNADIVFVAHEFKFDKLYFTSTGTRNLTFLVPDFAPDGLPTCNPPGSLTGNITLTNEANFSTNMAAMLYTPCKVYSERDGFRGQMYGGEVEFRQQASLVYVPVGVTGIDLSNGLTNPVQTGAELGDFVSMREIG